MSDDALIEAMARAISARLGIVWENITCDGQIELMTYAIAAIAATRKTHVTVSRGDLKEVCDLLAERKYGNPARSPAHNARVRLETLLTPTETTNGQ